ncbi:MAG TPA: EamA family transporter [Candidatus Limnocylindria bacterium]|nr:EamA family transporter [Candidatus Limnocylindria bacterium]
MTAEALALVLGAALLHAGWNALAKRARDPQAFLWWATCVGTVALLPFALVQVAATGIARSAVPFMIATVVLHGWYFYALGRAYRTGAFSLVYPVARGLGVAVVPGVALVVFDERLSAVGILGIVFVVCGVVALHFAPGTPAAGVAAARFGAASAWAVVTGLTIATYSLVDKAGVAHLHPVVYMTVIGLGCAIVLLPALAGRGEAVRREWRENWRTILAAGVMTGVGYLLVLFAFRLSKTGYVVAARELSIVFSAVIGSLWLHEGRLGPRLLGASIILLGVVCVAAGR